MKKVVDVKYYFDEEEDKRFKMSLALDGISIAYVIKKLNCSRAYLYSVLKGKTELTKDLVKRFNKAGYWFENNIQDEMLGLDKINEKELENDNKIE